MTSANTGAMLYDLYQPSYEATHWEPGSNVWLYSSVGKGRKASHRYSEALNFFQASFPPIE